MIKCFKKNVFGGKVMQILKDILHNHLIIVPIIAWAVSQIIKTVTIIVRDKKLSLRAMVKDGGMPSAHSATVVSLAVMCGWTLGFDSAAFAIAMIVAIVIMRDAVGVRWESGRNAKVIKELAKKANSDGSCEEASASAEKLKSDVGHTPLQVVCGCVVAVAVCILYILIGNIPMG